MSCSTADTNKWATPLKRGDSAQEPQVTSFDYERAGPIRQRQRKLSEVQTLLMINKYQNGATVYQLAHEFDISRHTVSKRLKKAGVSMRQQSPGCKCIDEMVTLYHSGLSLAEVEDRVGTSPRTVCCYLLIRGVKSRDFHG